MPLVNSYDDSWSRSTLALGTKSSGGAFFAHFIAVGRLHLEGRSLSLFSQLIMTSVLRGYRPQLCLYAFTIGHSLTRQTCHSSLPKHLTKPRLSCGGRPKDVSQAALLFERPFRHTSGTKYCQYCVKIITTSRVMWLLNKPVLS